LLVYLLFAFPAKPYDVAQLLLVTLGFGLYTTLGMIFFAPGRTNTSHVFKLSCEDNKFCLSISSSLILYFFAIELIVFHFITLCINHDTGGILIISPGCKTCLDVKPLDS